VYSEFAELHYITKKLESLLSRKDAIIHLCLDGRSPKGKRLLGENYKAGRHQEGSYSVYSGLATFIHLLHNNRINIYYNNYYESDEIIYTLSKTLDGRKKILSGDKDLLQSLDKDTVIESFKGLVTTEESYKYEYLDQFFGIDPCRLPIYRALTGDASDTLYPPVKRFPHKLAARIASDISYSGKCPSVEDLDSIKESLSKTEQKWVDRLIESYDKFSTNFDIMKLNIITDSLNNDYNYTDIKLDDFLKSKIETLNTL
jgi:DNA polymerase-1